MKQAILAGFALLIVPVSMPAGEATTMNPAATLRLAETIPVWTAPAAGVSARRARFSPDGKWLAWATSDGQLLAYDLEGKSTQAVWRAAGGAVGELVWSASGVLGACGRVADEGGSGGRLIVWTPGREASVLPVAEVPMNLAWRGDGKVVAAGTLTGLLVASATGADPERKILSAMAGWRPKGAAAYEDAGFAGDDVFARISGSMRWVLWRADGQTNDLGECRAVVPDMPRNRLYLVPWVAGPVGIPRGAGVARVDLADPKLERQPIVPGVPGQPYWLVDVADCEYPTTLRVSADGRMLSFAGVQAGVLAENAWREFAVWEAPVDGSVAPRAVVRMGCIFKRMDVGRDYVIGWRPAMEPGAVLGDLGRGRAWRLPEDVEVQRLNTDVRLDTLTIAAARGREVVLLRFEEQGGRP